eukprot:3934786-Rhodomonas_salina.1
MSQTVCLSVSLSLCLSLATACDCSRYAPLDTQTHSDRHRLTDIEAETEKETDGQTVGWTDGQVDRWTERSVRFRDASLQFTVALCTTFMLTSARTSICWRQLLCTLVLQRDQGRNLSRKQPCSHGACKNSNSEFGDLLAFGSASASGTAFVEREKLTGVEIVMAQVCVSLLTVSRRAFCCAGDSQA